MKVILFIVSTLRVTGPTKQLFYIIEHLNTSEYQPHVLTLSPETSDSYKEFFLSRNVNITTLGLSRIEGLFFGRRKLKELIKRINPSIIHTQGVRADRLLANLNVHIPWVLTSRNYPLDDYPMKFGFLKGYILAYSHLKAMRKCLNVIACSESISNSLKKHGVDSFAILNGVQFSLNTGDLKLMEFETLERPVFVTVGSLIKRKNTLFLLESFKEYLKTKKGTLIVVGDGPEFTELKDSASKNVYFLGHVMNVSDYLICSDYFVSASLSEGLPNTVLEAMLSGLPVILSNIPSHLEIAKECKTCCVTFDLEKGPLALAEYMLNVSEIFDANSGLTAKKIVIDKFSSQGMSDKYQQLYDKLIRSYEEL